MTFSIVAVDSATGDFGSAVASCSVAVGGTVSYSRMGVGVVNTQHQAHLAIGMRVLDQMDDGVPPQEALDKVLGAHVDADVRQFVAIDAKGRQGAWTGRDCTPERRHVYGGDCVAAGNYLANDKVVQLMVDAFKKSNGEILEQRLLNALLAGANAGGDRRGHNAAAISVVPGAQADTAINLDIRVDDHAEPFNEIVRLHKAFRREFPL